MTAGRLLAAQGAGLLVAGFGTAAVLLVRGQREASRHMAILEHQLDEVRSLDRGLVRRMEAVLEAAADEVGERRMARERR
jgi:hypothetical protein